MCSFIICVLSCYVCFVHSDWFLNSMCHTSYIVMSTGNVFFSSYMPYIVFCNYIRIAFLIRCALRFMLSCLLGMCSFIQGVLCFMFSYRFGMLSPIRCIICSTLSGQPVMCSFVLCVSCFTLSCPLALLFHPICYMFYIVMSTQVVSF